MRAKPQKINFTKAAIEGLDEPDEGRIYYYDAKQRGLAICITAAGAKTFYTVRKVARKTERRRIGTWPAWTVENARDEAAKDVGAIASGTNPNDKRRVDRNAPTLQQVFDEFIELPTRTKAKHPKSAKTVLGYRQQFEAYLAKWKDRQLSSITRHDVEKLHRQLGDKPGPHTANRVLALLKALFNVAIDLEYYTLNPAARVTGFAEQGRERRLHDDELPRFFAALEAEPSEKIRDFIKVALFTGQRRGNVLAMKWADVNLQRAVWSIPMTKSGKPHTVPLVAQAVDVLKRRAADKGGGEYVFPGRHGQEHLKDPMRQWRDILAAAGIDNLRIHDLRRSLASYQSDTNASLSVVGKTLGHTTPSATAGYSHMDLKPVRNAMETAVDAIMAASKPAKKKGGKRG